MRVRVRAFLLSVLSVFAAAQPAALDQGRLDPAWFGTTVVFQPSKRVAFQWLNPGFALHGRTIHVQEWEAPAWLGRKRGDQDRKWLLQLGGTIQALLEAGLRKGLGGQARVSRQEGDLLLVGRAVDACGPDDSGTFSGAISLTCDLKLVDAASGEVLAGFHHTISALSEANWTSLFAVWCEELGRTLAEKPKTAPVASPFAATPAEPRPSPRPAFDFDATLRRLQALRQDGILTESEFATLRRKAEEKAGTGRN